MPLALVVANKVLMAAARFPARSESVNSQFFAQRNWPDGILNRVIVDGKVSTVGIAYERWTEL